MNSGFLRNHNHCHQYSMYKYSANIDIDLLKPKKLCTLPFKTFNLPTFLFMCSHLRKPKYIHIKHRKEWKMTLTLVLPTWRIWWAPNNASKWQMGFNPLNAELNPICYLLALLGAHHFLHVGRIRVKPLTLRLQMSYIYIWSTYSWCF